MKKCVSILSLAAGLLIAAPAFAWNGHGGTRRGSMSQGGGFRGTAPRGGSWQGGVAYNNGSHGGGWHGGGWHGGGWHGAVIIGAPYAYAYPYAYYAAPYPVYPPVVAQGSPAYAAIDGPSEYIEQSSGPNVGGDWYYCPSSQAYYPDVQTCPEAWMRVPQ